MHVEEDDLKRLYAEQFSKQPAGGETVHLRQILIVFGPEVGRDRVEACRLASAALRRASAQGDVLRGRRARGLGGGADGRRRHRLDPRGQHGAVDDRRRSRRSQPGGVTDVIELPFGCGMMKLVERREWVPVSYEAAKPALEQEVFEEKLADEYRTWMDQLRKNSYIERRGYFADAAQLGAGALGGEHGRARRPTEGSGSP